MKKAAGQEEGGRSRRATKMGETFPNEGGLDCGYCVCGEGKPSIHPDCGFGGLDYCEDCGYVTCGACRVHVGSTPFCIYCAPKHADE